MGLYEEITRNINRVGKAAVTPMPNHRFIVMHGQEFLQEAEIYSDSGVEFPAEPAAPEVWQVGYILNVLTDVVEARYGAGGETRSFSFGGPISDKMTPGAGAAWVVDRPSYVTWNKQTITPYKEFQYSSGGRRHLVARLTFRDAPRRTYLNEFKNELAHKNNLKANQLREVNETIEFGIWIAAKRKSDSPYDIAAYHVLHGTYAKYIFRFSVPGNMFPNVFQKQDEIDRGVTRAPNWTAEANLVDPRREDPRGVTYGGNIIAPVNTNETANTLLLTRLAASGIVFVPPIGSTSEWKKMAPWLNNLIGP